MNTGLQTVPQRDEETVRETGYSVLCEHRGTYIILQYIESHYEDAFFYKVLRGPYYYTRTHANTHTHTHTHTVMSSMITDLFIPMQYISRSA